MKERLDLLLVRRGFFDTREKARRSIMAGNILVNGVVEDKPGTEVSREADITVAEPKNLYVSRGGIKLEKALREFGIDVRDKVAIDVGASTGGFTDCLLQHGARKVYAIDVGYGQFAWTLRHDPRVVNLERTNIRYVSLDDIGERTHLCTVDVSFISIRKFLGNLKALLTDNGEVVSLIKPQFEAGREKVGKRGVVRDPRIHHEVVRDIAAFAQESGYAVKGITFSPLKGPEGNIEYFIHLRVRPFTLGARPADPPVDPPIGPETQPAGPTIDKWEPVVGEIVYAAHAFFARECI